MPTTPQNPTWKTDGKFLRRGTSRQWMRAVTYGPFPPGKEPHLLTELTRIRSAGFNTLRLYHLPDTHLLDTAHQTGLQVLAGLDSWQYSDFIAQPRILSGAKISLTQWLTTHATHPALSGLYVGNEIPSDLVRYIGPTTVRTTIEDLITLGRSIAPHLLFAYANYPSTEYLEPANADFSAFNIYLENPHTLTAYLQRLHNIAGDRPLIISEFGLDSLRNTPTTQATTIDWALHTAHTLETAGITIFSWTDLWQNNGTEITDWAFGLTDRHGSPKPALTTCENFHPTPTPPTHTFTIIICTHNGRENLPATLHSLTAITSHPFQTILVDDGSTDHTSAYISENFPHIHLITIPHSGLSTARNTGASAATGDILAFTDDDCQPDPEWLTRLEKAFQNPEIAAAGGPNLPPPPTTLTQAVIQSAPGAPSHVLLTDTTAEHLPGCNLAIRRTALHQINGFDPAFHTAGDDVDLCWRLSDSHLTMAFVPGAFVWHHRRPTLRAYLKQQIGYGKAEKILLQKHPHRFLKNGEAHWHGFIYSGAPTRTTTHSIIYHGTMGQAPFQSIVNPTLPLRPIAPPFQNTTSHILLKILQTLQPILRRWARNHTLQLTLPTFPKKNPPPETLELRIPTPPGKTRTHYLHHLLQNGWHPAGPTSPWDLVKNHTKIIIATEHHTTTHSTTTHSTTTLIRISGDPTLLPENL